MISFRENVKLADATDQEKAILGPIPWQHQSHTCNCSDDAPQDLEAYMSQGCESSYRRGVANWNSRLRLLRQHNN